MNKPKSRRRFLTLILILVLAFGGLKFYQNFLLSPVDASSKEIKIFTVEKGEGTRQVASKLQKAGLIKSANAFTILVKSQGDKNVIQAGNFKLSPAMDAKTILSELQTGTLDKQVTLLEGWRAEEMGEKLGAELGINSSQFVRQAKEGYMFPDTYMFTPQADIPEITKALRQNFDQKYTADLQNKIRSLGLTPEEGVILASIVEREARSDEVRRMVASILLKRLKIGMALNADATIQYIVGYQKSEGSWWKKNLTADDLKVESPYNTYLNPGLPPTPIANPGVSSLQAVANANPKVPYLYYYHDSKGRSYYAKTLDEHNANVANHP